MRPSRVGVRVELRKNLTHDIGHIVPGNDQVAPALPLLLPIAHEIALAARRLVQMAQLVERRLVDIHLRQELVHEHASKALVLRPERTRGKGDDVVIRRRQVHHQHCAHCRSLHGRELDPALAERLAIGEVDNRRDGVVLLDDALVQAIGLFVGEQERRLDDGLFAELLELEARPKHDAGEHQHRDDDRRQQQKREQAGTPRAVGHAQTIAEAPRGLTRGAARRPGRARSVGSTAAPRAARRCNRAR
jgi:hypothetical protein